MQLSTFINENMQNILREWESFARTLFPATPAITAMVLRDHAKQMLEEIASGIDDPQSQRQAKEKSKGMARDDTQSAASIHGTLRQESGLTMNQLVAEFRALRATVLRAWLPQVGQVTESTTNDMVRFNEAIDQAVTESIARFTESTDRSRDMFLAILGHDLRTPLAAMGMAGEYLTTPEVGTHKTKEVGMRVKRSTASMTRMVDDLLEYSRLQLGKDMPVSRKKIDALGICQAAVEEVRAAHPDCEIALESSGDLSGDFDGPRLQQVITNLLTNAIQYRSKEHPVILSAAGEADKIVLTVRNRGPIIPHDALESIFNPLIQLPGDSQNEGRPSTSLGLGLFIARNITEAHKGSITAQSTEDSGTVFTVLLPKEANDA